MSLIEKVEAYTQSQLLCNQNESDFLTNLENFLNQNKKTRVEHQLLQQIQSWKQFDKSDDRVYALLSDFIRKNKVHSSFDANKFLNSNPRPNLSMFKSLSSDELKACVAYDKKEFSYHTQIVHVLNKENADTDFIIWLLEQGFQGSSWDTAIICENENLPLLKYYIENKICKDLNCHALGALVKKNNLVMFNYILDNNLIPEEYFSKNATFYSTISNGIEKANLLMLQLLYGKDSKFFRQIIQKEFYGFPPRMKNAPNTICLWLWENDMKWTQQIANQSNNKFMLSFF